MDETVFVGRRNGVVVGLWSGRPVMMDVPVEKRTQDYDLTFEELPDSHPEVIAFREARPALPPDLLRPLSDREWRAQAERFAQQHAEGERLNLAMLAFQRQFTELETAMSALLHCLVDGGKSQIAYAIYYSITGFGGRLTAVGNALEQWTRENKQQKDLSVKWGAFAAAARRIAQVRNTIAHGAPLTINGRDVRLTSPPFDVLHVGWPMADGSIPGYSAANLEHAVGEILQLRQSADDFNNYVSALRTGSDVLPGMFRALSDRLTPFEKTGLVTQKKPKQEPHRRSSSAQRRKEAIGRSTRRGKNDKT